MATKPELEVQLEGAYRLIDRLRSKLDKTGEQPALAGVRTNLNDTPAYIISAEDYQRLGGI